MAMIWGATFEALAVGTGLIREGGRERDEDGLEENRLIDNRLKDRRAA
jgi:hypothetical protein